jgi:hypothetical protein
MVSSAQRGHVTDERGSTIMTEQQLTFLAGIEFILVGFVVWIRSLRHTGSQRKGNRTTGSVSLVVGLVFSIFAVTFAFQPQVATAPIWIVLLIGICLLFVAGMFVVETPRVLRYRRQHQAS